ncbi:MAG: endonuclease/exonuclease/phosphatase family protein [Prochlorococcaceae cyanobacterium]
MSSLKVMCWNVENLFLPPADDAAAQDRFLRKLANLAAVIDGEQPDVLALQEIGPDGALEALQQALTHSMPHALEGIPDRRGIRVAFLSKHPISRQHTIQRFPPLIRPVQAVDPVFDDPATEPDESLNQAMGRGALEVEIDLDGEAVTVITAHFKSKLISYARRRPDAAGSTFSPRDEDERYRYAAYALYRRTGESVTIRDRINALLSGDQGEPDPRQGQGREKAVVFCGDLNDQPDAATTQIIQGPSGSEIDTQGFRSPDKGDGYRLWNLAPILNRSENGQPPAEAPYTRRFEGRGELIDHIFASHRLVNPNNIPKAWTVAATPALPSISETPYERRDDPASDHAAVVACFSLRVRHRGRTG